jgi:hypothetical protein
MTEIEIVILILMIGYFSYPYIEVITTILSNTWIEYKNQNKDE